jgi:DNA invertase Pin-like site-specific DNA recombinase
MQTRPVSFRARGGIAKAKAAGVYKGRPASIDAAQVRAMKAQGLGASGIQGRIDRIAKVIQRFETEPIANLGAAFGAPSLFRE